MNEAVVPEAIQIYPAFTIFDRKADRYDFPMCAPNQDIAIRRFGDMMDQEGTVFHLHAEDFDLFLCGEWDMVSGIFIASERHYIINGETVKRKTS